MHGIIIGSLFGTLSLVSNRWCEVTYQACYAVSTNVRTGYEPVTRYVTYRYYNSCDSNAAADVMHTRYYTLLS